MPDTPNLTKIAILGGGMSAMTAAFELTSAPGWDQKYEVTVYQVGWRLGGKGASGRNPRAANRIEEHGFHFWWGFYDNAFRLMQDCYRELGRPLGTPLATWQEAFKPFDYLVSEYHFSRRWMPYVNAYPPNDLTPGEDLDRPLPAPAEYLSLLLKQLADGIAASQQATMQVQLPGSLSAAKLPWWKSLLKDMEAEAGELGVGMAAGLLRLCQRLAVKSQDEDYDLADRLRYEIIDELLKVLIGALWDMVKDEVEKDFNTYVNFVNADYAIAAARGMINDGILEKGLDVINHKDFRQWLRDNGAQELTVRSGTVRFIYDEVFAYEDGDTRKPNLEAGTALRILLRYLFTYKGSFIWRMEAGMGDTIFGPLYQVLVARGVKFKFFHRVEKLHLSPDQKRVAAITMARQVNIKDGAEYQPLMDVKGLPCWPSEPLAGQIVEGEMLSERVVVDGVEMPKYDLESYWTAWPNAQDNLRLEAGVDFDVVLLGISLGALPVICEELLQAEGKTGEQWRSMVAHVKTNQTQAFQLWLKPDNAGLGWGVWRRGLPAVMAGYDVGENMVDAWADMSHLIPRESWPDDHYPGNISYWVSVLTGPDATQLPPPGDHEFPHQQVRRVISKGTQFLERHLQPVWPQACGSGGGLDCELLVDLGDRQGRERLHGQFWRANVDPSERYVMAVAGSGQHRLRTDQSGCDNLYLTGDWIANGANAGFVESAVMSGMLAAQAITRRLLGKAWPERIVWGA